MGWRKTNFYLHWDIFLILLLLYNSFKRQYMNGAGAKIRDKGGAGAGSATLVLRTVLGTKYTLLHFSVSSIRFSTFLSQVYAFFSNRPESTFCSCYRISLRNCIYMHGTDVLFFEFYWTNFLNFIDQWLLI